MLVIKYKNESATESGIVTQLVEGFLPFTELKEIMYNRNTQGDELKRYMEDEVKSLGGYSELEFERLLKDVKSNGSRPIGILVNRDGSLELAPKDLLTFKACLSFNTIVVQVLVSYYYKAENHVNAFDGLIV